MLRKLAILALAASFAGLAWGKTEEVVHLTDADFKEKVADGKVYFIKFFAPWCGHCKRLAPTWADLAGELKGTDPIAIASVDCTTEKNTCAEQQIRGYPTLKVFQGGEAKEQYKGARELAALKDFIQAQKRTLLDETTE